MLQSFFLVKKNKPRPLFLLGSLSRSSEIVTQRGDFVPKKTASLEDITVICLIRTAEASY